MDAPAPTGAVSTQSPARRGLTGLAGWIKPPTPAVRGFALATLVTATGNGMYITVSVVLFVRSLHLSAGFVGTGLTIAALCGLGAALPAGRLVDRHGAKPVLVGLFAAQALLYALFPLVSSPAEFLVAVILVAIAANASSPASQALLSELVADGPRVRAAAYNRSILNVGMSVGALFAAAALATDTRFAYNAILIGDAVSFVGAAVLVSRFQAQARAERAASRPGSPAAAAPDRHPLRDPRFVAAAVICGVLYLSASVLDVALPLQVSQHTSAPRWMISALILLNTILTVTLQVRASAGSESIAGAARANRLAGIALFGACVLFAATTSRGLIVAVIVLVAATVSLTAGELFSSAGTWGMSYGLAPRNQQGKYLASFGLVSELVQTVGPVIAVAVVGGGFAGWLLVGVVFLGTGLSAPVIARAKKPVSDSVP